MPTAKQISELAAQKAKKIGTRTSFALNAAMLAFLAIAYLGAKTGVVHADVQFDGLTIGGGTAEHAAREQQIAALAKAMPVNALTPPTQHEGPLPTRKPQVQ